MAGGILQAGDHIFLNQSGEFFQHFFDGVTDSQKLHHRFYGDPRAAHDGLAIANSGVNYDAFKNGATLCKGQSSAIKSQINLKVAVV